MAETRSRIWLLTGIGLATLLTGVTLSIAALTVILNVQPPPQTAAPIAADTTALPDMDARILTLADALEQLERQFSAAEEQLTAAEERLKLEQAANAPLREELNKLRLERDALAAKNKELREELARLREGGRAR